MISIIIPTINEEEYIGSLLSDLEKQTYRDFEVIVVDSKSDDRTEEIANCFSAGFPLKLISDERKGPGSARNVGVKIAKGDLLLFLDADVSIPKNWLEKCLREFGRRKLTVATCYIWPKSRSNRDRILWLFFFNWVYAMTQYYFQTACGLCIFVKKSEHLKLNGFDESIKIGEDAHYFRRAARLGKYRILNKVIYVSTRRTDLEGRLGVLLKYARAGIKQIFLRSYYVRVGYNFGHYKKLNQSRQPQNKPNSERNS